FFFQAEDGIRDKLVTGVQTCALPIWVGEVKGDANDRLTRGTAPLVAQIAERAELLQPLAIELAIELLHKALQRGAFEFESQLARSEERRVGKECGPRGGVEEERGMTG